MTSSESNKSNSPLSKHNDAQEQITSVRVTHLQLQRDETIDLADNRPAVFDFYSCEEAIKRLNDYLDTELDPAEREDVLKHLKVCGPCLERFHFEKSLMITLREKVRSTMAPLKLRERLALLMKSGD